ncbi:sensor histidine kinase [candidate division KSB1 bacterium]
MKNIRQPSKDASQVEINMLKERIVDFRAQIKDTSTNNELLKKIIDKYVQAERKLAELNRLKNKFLGIAAHDLRNPLASIISFSEIIRDEETGPVNEEQKEFLDLINKSGIQMLNLVNELLDVAVIESGELRIDSQVHSIKELLEERFKINSNIAAKKNIKLHTSFNEIPELRFDRDKIAQVIDNLTSNAVKFSPPDTNIYLSLKFEKDKAVVSVRDEGPGISEEDRKKLFGEFQKLSARPTGGEKSTGLGLAIVKKIIEAHKGKIWVESKLNKGTCFYFTLPE